MKENITKPALFWKLLQVVIKKKKKNQAGGGGRQKLHQNAKIKNEILNIDVFTLMRHLERITQCQNWYYTESEEKKKKKKMRLQDIG